MGQRLDFHQVLVDLMGEDGPVYFQPPSSDKMVYPCILYDLDFMDTKFAGNKPYHVDDRYLVTVIDRDPDSTIRKRVANLPLCGFNRAYKVDNLYHTAFRIYF